jgi:hypothetical protein
LRRAILSENLRHERRAQARTVPQWDIAARIFLGQCAPAIAQSAAAIVRVVAPAILPGIECFAGLFDAGTGAGAGRDAGTWYNRKPG